MKRSGIAAALMLLALIAALSSKGLLVRLPEQPEVAPVHGFDAGRAVARLAYVLGDQRPHPVDSEANDAVRARLIAQLRDIGLNPRVTDDFACSSSKRSPAMSCAHVRNVIATMGPQTGKHLMLVSHYDSSPVGPGASDDGIGMAVMLETASKLPRDKLTQPVTLLFTDGEEAGLLGARAFLAKDPLANRVGTLLNFEARGVTGPAIMFETNTPNGAAIGLYKAAVDRPAANSLTADFAKLIPNSTDVEVFKARRDWTILNFAVIGNETRYHTPGDDLGALDRRSVQHMGDQALALATFATSGKHASAVGEHPYADLLGQGMVVMPLWASFATLGAAALLFVFIGWRRRRGLGRAALAVFAPIAGAAALAWLGKNAVGLVRTGEFWRGYPEVTALAVYVSTLLAALAALGWIARRSEIGTLRAAYWIVFLIIGGALSTLAPGASIFFLLPPLVAGLGMLAGKKWPRAERLASLLAFLLIFLSWGPLLHLSQILLDFDAAWIFAPIAAIIMLPALIEMAGLLRDIPRKLLLGGAAAVFVAAWALTAIVPAYTQDRKQAFGIEYLWDSTTGKAQWLIAHDGAELPEGFGALRKDVTVPYSMRKRWAAPTAW